MVETSRNPDRGVAVVTGGGGALGRATALRLADDGFAVAVLDLPGPGLEKSAQLLRQRGNAGLAVDIDLRDVEAIDAAIHRIEAELGPITALVNNAGIYPTSSFLDTPIAQYDDVVAVNQRGYFAAAQAAARVMAPRGLGSIVNVSSITWHGGWSDLSSYVSTKGAAIALTHAIAWELGPSGIRVNAIAPGAFPTKAEEIHEDQSAYTARVLSSQAIKRRPDPSEFAAVVSFLVGPDSSFITGQTINVDGGWKMR